jgi:SAM-dependent methyltransferase
MSAAAIWHDVECGAYDVDLTLWEELSQGGCSVLDLGCGTGRVALHLARRGRRVTAVDRERQLLDTLAHRAAQRDLEIETVCGDATEVDVGRRFDAVFAPMQFVQLFRGAHERGALLRNALRHLRPGGTFATTLMNLDGELLGDDYGPPPPDMREVDGWVYSSLSVGVRPVERGGAVVIERLRTAVSPAGEQFRSADQVRLELLAPATLELEMAAVGFDVGQRRELPATDEHVGSFVVVASAPGGAA